MKSERGVTLAVLAITVILLGILMTFMLNTRSYNQLLKSKNSVEAEFNGVVTENDKKINTIKSQWGDIL